jgi:hypothetical protein
MINSLKNPAQAVDPAKNFTSCPLHSERRGQLQFDGKSDGKKLRHYGSRKITVA